MRSMTAKNAAAVALGRKGGQATAQKLSPQARKESARKAAEARWAKLRALTKEIKDGAKKLERRSLKRLNEIEKLTKKTKAEK